MNKGVELTFKIILIVSFIVTSIFVIKRFVVEPYKDVQNTSSYTYERNADDESPTSDVNTTDEDDYIVQDIFLDLLEQNPDTCGWIAVDDSPIDYPVVYTPDDQNKYIRKDYNGNSSSSGTLFLSSESRICPQSKSIIIYGHNMKNGSMFGTLPKYKNIDYLKAHPVIHFDTLYKKSDWKIIAVCMTSLDFERNDFCYLQADYASPEDFSAFIRDLRYRSFFRISDDINFNDSLLILSTCNYSFTNARFIVVARRLRQGEAVSSEITEGYQNNPLVRYPNEYYSSQSYVPDESDIIKNYNEFYER